MGIKLYSNHAFCLSDFEKFIHILQPKENVTIDIRKHNISHLDKVLEKTKPSTLTIHIKHAGITLDLDKYKHLKYVTVSGNNKTYIKSLPELKTLKLENCFMKIIASVTIKISLRKTIARFINLLYLDRLKIINCNKFIYINATEIKEIDSSNSYIRKCHTRG